MMWTMAFWHTTLWALVHGEPLSPYYFITITPFINQFAAHSSLVWGLMAWVMSTTHITLYKLGRGFLKSIQSLPVSLALQKNVCIVLELIAIVLWVGVLLYVAWIVVIGEIGYHSMVFLRFVVAHFLVAWLTGTALGVVCGLIIKRTLSRYFEPYCSHWMDELKRHTETRLTDIREVYQAMAKPVSFEPETYFKAGAMFFGLDEHQKPIYLDWSQFVKTHVQVMGCTGSGKGVVSVCLLAQVLMNEGAAVVFEPKQGGDEWAPHVLKSMALRYGKGFHLIDLQALVPQLNLLKDISPEQLDQLLQAGMGIEDKGGDGDYYRLKDRKAARQGSYLANQAQNFPHFQSLMREQLGDHLKIADSFSDKLEMLCEINAVQTSAGLDLKAVLEKGDCIYIIGSSDRAQIRLLQRMVLLRIKQLIEHRDRLVKHRHVTLFIDEVKYFLTRPVLDSLAMIRDHQCNLILAHQAPGDLYDVPKDIDGNACYACVTNNTNIKLIYKINDDSDRKMAAALTGSKVIQRDSKEVLTNSGMGELIETDKKHTMEMQVPLYDENFFAALNERIGVLLGVGVAKLVFTSPIKTAKQALVLVAAEPCPSYQDSQGDVSDLKESSKPSRLPKPETEHHSLAQLAAQADDDSVPILDDFLYDTNEHEEFHNAQ